MSLEQLADLEVTSVSKKAERLADAPASIFVITAEDIRRSGARTLTDALRLAPNLQVAQSSSSGFTIRARGVTNTSPDKLLVLIDGRSVYSPLYSGVFWDVQDVVLEDIERIEVVSGPGGTLWGVNAMNGVINVITRSAAQTRGTLIAADGSELDSHVAARLGARLGENASYRVYAKYFDQGVTSTAADARVGDGWYKAQAGFRADGSIPSGHWMLQGNVYRGAIGQPRTAAAASLPAASVQGANLTGNWSHRFDGGSELSLQAYYDRTDRTVHGTFGEKLDIFDLQVQHTLALAKSTSLVWGGEVRYSNDHVTNSDAIAFLPPTVHQGWYSLFAQAETSLAASLRFTLGARLERNDYTGTEFLPNVRLAWKPGGDHLIWSSIARTVRAPSRLDRDAYIPGKPPYLLAGNPDTPSEVANVYELGYRGQAAQRATYSITFFHADYDRLHAVQRPQGQTVFVFTGGLKAKTTGVEAWGTWQASKAWRLSAGYMAERERFSLKAGATDANAVSLAGRDPANSWLLRSSLALAPALDFDITARGSAALTNLAVPRYAVVDLRLAWRPQAGVELAVGARNLGGGHGEYGAVALRTEIDRSYFVGVRWDFDAR